jgi:hypothetical protein
VLRRRLWLIAPIAVAGAVWAYAQITPSPWSAPTTTATAPALAPAPATTPANPEEPLLGPEIWRLPPVNSPSPSEPLVAPKAPLATPPALDVPPAELVPEHGPDGALPRANAPWSLSGTLSNGERLDAKPSKAEKLWDGSLDLGWNGSEGNNQMFNFHFGFHANRKAESNILTLSLDYNKQTAQSVTTSNLLFFDGRFEWLIKQTRWSWFVHETVQYDEFQPFNVLDTSDAGLGYRLLKNDITTLIGRIGGGFSHEYGGPENGQFFPEAVFGVQLERHISKRQKLLGVVEYAADVGDFDRYRIRTQAAWEMLLDQDKNLSLRVGVLDWYNSMPNINRPNELDYALMVMWKF